MKLAKMGKKEFDEIPFAVLGPPDWFKLCQSLAVITIYRYPIDFFPAGVGEVGVICEKRDGEDRPILRIICAEVPGENP
jgi:hypothetical protein